MRKIKNVRLGLCVDGFNPFSNLDQQYSCGFVILNPYDIPLMKKQYMFLKAIVPDLSNPKHKINLYLQPLIHELKLLWKDRIQMYDVFNKE